MLHYPPLHSTSTLSNNIISKIIMWINLCITNIFRHPNLWITIWYTWYMTEYIPNTKIKHPTSEYSIVTIPRSGSNYLQDRIEQHTGIFVKKSHELQNNKMITVVRDPIDFLSSYVAMDALYFGSLDNFLSNPQDWCFSSWYTENDMDIVDNFDIIITYESLINSPLETIKKIADKMSVEIIEDRYKSNVVDKAYRNHVKSSKSLKDYDTIRQIVEKQDLSKTYEIYNKFLAKAI